jgi:hypothetical protein
MRDRIVQLVALTMLSRCMFGQPIQDSATNSVLVKHLENVSWWAGIVEHGFQMPLADGYAANVCGENYENQVQPLLLSNQGDVIWSLRFSSNREVCSWNRKMAACFKTKLEAHCVKRFCMQAGHIFLPLENLRINRCFRALNIILGLN